MLQEARHEKICQNHLAMRVKMNIYFSCSITGGRNDQPVYQEIVNALLLAGHVVPTAYLSSADIQRLETIVDAREVYRRDVGWVKGCDVLIAEVSTPSHGVGYEIALAEAIGKPVFCCYETGKRVSKMLLGNSSPNFKVQSYQTPAEAVSHIKEFLKHTPVS
jgi:nucleoside 2-deoxyribosyltransferase